MRRWRSLRSWVGAAAAACALAGCGGGGSDLVPPLPGITCSSPEQRLWLDDYFDEWYFWYRIAPSPSPLPDRTVAEFFEASLYKGGDARFPPDRWSRMERSADYDRFFNDGRLLGYGVYLAGIEVAGQPERPLRVRFVEERSDAAAQGVRRGDEVVSANGRSAASMVAADDFGVFTPTEAGQRLDLVLRSAGVERRVTLVASAFVLTPLSHQSVVQTDGGRRVAYAAVKDMISQVEAPLGAAFSAFRAAGAQELVLDLRYNGGGLVSTATTVASLAGGSRTDERTFARLLYNDKRSGRNNETYRFTSQAGALGVSRVYVLTGPRTCSASELVVNGLKPWVEVVTIGGRTCGKPVGFLPASRCDTTFSVVNFESVNARDEGRYFDGIGASCEVQEDLSQPLGSPSEPLLAAALRHVDSGRCPPSAQPAQKRRALRADGQPLRGEPPERQGMWAR